MATLLVIFKLIEAGTCRSEQNSVARLRGANGELHGSIQSLGVDVRHRISEIRRDLAGRRAYQNRRSPMLLERLGQRRVRAALVFAAQNHDEWSRKRFDRLQRRVYIRRFRVVEKLDAVDFSQE